jgi:hypothetical protein
MNGYVRVISVILTFVIVAIIGWLLYSRYIKPIPGDTISTPSNYTLHKSTPISTLTQNRLQDGIQMTRHGAVSFLMTLNSVETPAVNKPVFSPIITFYRGDNIPIFSFVINRISNDVGTLFYDSSKSSPEDDPFYVPITTARVKDKTAILLQMLPDINSNELQLAIFLDGMFVLSRGIPANYNIPVSTTLNVLSGPTKPNVGGADVEIQTIRIWTDSRGLTTSDMISTAEDPLNSSFSTRK